MTPASPRIMTRPEIAVGVDPGSRVTGIGIISGENGKLVHINHFPIRIPESLEQAEKLLYFANQFQTVFNMVPTGTIVIESLFTAKNVSSILKLSHVRGVAMMLAAKNGWTVVELPPATIKVSVTGYGRATKEQVQYMVQKILRLPQLPVPADCSDALAMAICFLNQTRLQRRIRARS